MCQVGSYRTVVAWVVIELQDSYKTVALMTYFRKPFNCTILLFNSIKELCFIHTLTLLGVKYNKILKYGHFICRNNTALGKSLVTNSYSTLLHFMVVPSTVHM